MRRVIEPAAAWAMDSVMCSMMNALQWRRRRDASTVEALECYLDHCAALSREDYYRPPTNEVPPSLSGGRLEWASPVCSGFDENDTARVLFFPAADPAAPTVLLLHALMSASDIGYRRVAAWFNARGWSVAFPQLPFHYSRTPRGYLNGELAVTANLVRNAEGLRQGVTELRQLMAFLRRRGSDEFAILGTSYGGWTGALLSFLEKDVRFVALVQPIVNVERAVWENPGARMMRESLVRLGHSPGNTLPHVHLTSPKHGVPLSENVLVTAGEFDRVSPVRDLEEVSRKWPGSRLIRVRQGHFGYTALRRTLEEVEPLL